MTRRSPFAVWILGIVTFGIYYLVWLVKTKDEMNSQGAQIPTAWLIIVPIANIYWMWKWGEGVGVVTKGQTSGVMAFLMIFLPYVNILAGSAVVQAGLNKVATGGAMAKAA
jgi:hypothetical protein